MARRMSSSIRSSRRKVVWARSIVNDLTVPTTGVVTNFLASFETDYGANLIGSTVIRIRGLIGASPNVSTGPSQLVLGVRVNSDATVALGNGPFDQPHLDWMGWEPFIFRFGGITGNEMNRDDAVSRQVDIKSQRKLEEINEQLSVWSQGNQQAWTVSWNLSILLKLP